MDRGRQLAGWTYREFGAAYFRVVAVGGSAAIAFLSIWPLSTVAIVVLIAALAPVASKLRRTQSGPAGETNDLGAPTAPVR